MKAVLSTLFIFLNLGSSWDHSFYRQFDHLSFFNRQDVNQKIDLNDFDRDLLEAAIFYATNEIRLKKKRSAFSFSEVLLKSSRAHSEAMHKNNFFDHVNRKDKKSRTLTKRIIKAGGGFNAFAENIARVNIYQLEKKGTYFVDEDGNKVNSKGEALQTKTYKELAQDVVDKWMHSKGHKKNILAEHSYLGCGTSQIVYNNQGIPEILITQNFGEK